MKQFCFSMVLLLALVSCSNDNEITPEEKACEVMFNVSTLDVEVQPMSRATVPASDALTNIHYYVKNTSTNKVFQGTQTLANAGSEFGTIKLWVPVGTYEATFFGYGTNNTSGQALMYVHKDTQSPRISLKNKDSFIFTDDVSVDEETSNIDVNLTRLNGALVIRLNDEIPSDIGKIKVSLNYYPEWIISDGKAFYEGNDGFATSFSDELTIKNSSVEEYIYYVLPQTGRSVTLTLFDSSGAELGSTSVAVSFYQNRKTIVEGNLLDIISQKPFAITVTDDWGEDVVVPLE